MPKDELKELQESMDKAIDFLQNEYLSIRTGRAHPGLVSDIKLDYYGTPTPLKQIANITIPESRTIQIAPFDRTSLKAIEKAILAANIGMTPQNDGASIRLTLPELTRERRVELTKLLAKKAEDARVVVRHYRRDAIESLKKQEKASEITEDDLKTLTKGVQDKTDAYVKKVDEIYKAKEKEVFLCTQCCEHLNRAIIIEGAVAEKLGFLDAIVNVVPKEKAGGSFSTVAYESFHEPVALERVRTDGGMDIGDTFIGMHLKEVAVPLRLSKNTLGEAHLTAARVRPKCIGGVRAQYDESLL